MVKLSEGNLEGRYAAVAQLDRVFGYEPKGRGFESLQPYQKEKHRYAVLFFLVSLPRGFNMLGGSEFRLRQGFAAQNACTAHQRRPTVWGPCRLLTLACGLMRRGMRGERAFFVNTWHEKP
jgi:hypothetical protein